MPGMAGYTFTPPGKSFSNLQSNVMADFTAAIPSIWQTGALYAIGVLITYQGEEYQCIQGHTSQVGWEPPFVPTFWQKTGTNPPGKLQAPWSAQDVGSVGYAGTAAHDANVFTVKGSGADIWGTADAAHGLRFELLKLRGCRRGAELGSAHAHRKRRHGLLVRKRVILE